MSIAHGFDFCASSSFVTHNADCTYVLTTDGYPTVRDGFTFGTISPATAVGANRDSTVDPRLAGVITRVSSASQWGWRLNLPAAGYYLIRLALGDATVAHGVNQYLTLGDNVTTLFAAGGITAAGHFIDATGVDCHLAVWPGSNAPALLRFTTAILILSLGHPVTTSDTSALAHLYVESAPAPDAIAQELPPPRVPVEVLL